MRWHQGTFFYNEVSVWIVGIKCIHAVEGYFLTHVSWVVLCWKQKGVLSTGDACVCCSCGKNMSNTTISLMITISSSLSVSFFDPDSLLPSLRSGTTAFRKHPIVVCFLAFQVSEKWQESLLFECASSECRLSDEPIKPSCRGSLITGAYRDDTA